MYRSLASLFGYLLVILYLVVPTTSAAFNIERSKVSARNSYGQTNAKAEDGHPTRSGGTSYRFEVRDGDCGSFGSWSDCSHDRERQEKMSKVKKEGWFHWSLFIPADYPIIYPTKVALAQFHQDKGAPVLMFQNDRGGYWADRQKNGESVGQVKLLSDEEMRGKWTDVLVHAHWSKKWDGFVRVYVNGEVEPRYQKVGATSDGKSVYFKFGIYRTFMSRYKMNNKNAPVSTQIVYFDDLESGKTCKDVTEHFDCDRILEIEPTLPQPQPPLSYKRDEDDIVAKFNCWINRHTGEADLPSEDEIEDFADELEDFDNKLSKFAIRDKGLSKATWLAHRDSIADLVNHLGSIEEYCSQSDS